MSQSNKSIINASNPNKDTSFSSSKDTAFNTSQDTSFSPNKDTNSQIIENIMKGTHFLLPTRGPASGVAVTPTEYIATDGINPYAYVYSFCGVFKGAVPTLRPYEKIVYCSETDSYYATDGYCSGRIYTLNCRLEETDSFPLRSVGVVLDISLYSESSDPCGCSCSLVVTSPCRTDLFTSKGNYLSTLRQGGRNSRFISFVQRDNGFAEGFSSDRREYIIFRNGCTETTNELERCVRLKSLFSTDGGGVWGLFTKNYSNNYIMPVFENDTLNNGFSRCGTVFP